MQSDAAREVAGAIRTARKVSGLTKPRFAARLHVTPAALRALETGCDNVSAVTLVAAARIAGQPVSAILGELPFYEGPTLPDLERRVLRLEGNQSQLSTHPETDRVGQG